MSLLEHQKFLNRKEELKLLTIHAKNPGLVILLGRRRTGKTALLKKWVSKNNGFYSQAIEGSLELQLAQTVEDFQEKFSLPSKPNTWLELFRLIDVIGKKQIICLDEFQYLIKSDSTLPSVMQKWLDHENRSGSLVILSGSSMKIMKEACLESHSPLYGRAKQVIHLSPMPYQHLAEYFSVDKSDPELFEIYSLVGGIPKYWEYIQLIKKIRKLKKISGLSVIEELYFSNSPFMEGELQRILNDERIDGLSPLSVLEAIGRGARRPNEIASRLGVPQTQLFKVFEQLRSAHVIIKEVPFGSPESNNKTINLTIADPSTRAWFALSSVHRVRWPLYSKKKRKEIFSSYCGNIFEQYVRNCIPGTQRYWNTSIEIDLIYQKEEELCIGEVKWGKITVAESRVLLSQLKEKFLKTNLATRAKKIKFELYDQNFLQTQKPSFRSD